jgi:hypothetical protein
LFQYQIDLLVFNEFSWHQYFLLELKEQKFVLIGKKLFSGNGRFQKEESVKKVWMQKKVFSDSSQSKTL